MVIRRGVLLAGLAAVAGGLLLATPAYAGAVETHVFPVGDELRGRGTPAVHAPQRPSRRISPLTSASAFDRFSRLSEANEGAKHSRVPDPAEYPFSAHGKVVIGIGGQLSSCSGTVIATPNRSTMITAAHCVREGYGHRGRWVRQAAFIPAYELGERPYGTFRATRLWVPGPYWRTENPNFDVAVVRLRPNGRGRVASVVGARGWMANVMRARSYEVFGYPAGAMKGEIPRYCDSRVRGVRRLARFIAGPAPLRVRCLMARGSSGGGWIFGGRYLNSVIGYSEVGHPEYLYGPYFGRAIQRLIQRVG